MRVAGVVSSTWSKQIDGNSETVEALRAKKTPVSRGVLLCRKADLCKEMQSAAKYSCQLIDERAG